MWGFISKLVSKIFTDYIRKTVKIYIDDMLVKTFQAKYHLKHLEKAVNIL